VAAAAASVVAWARLLGGLAQRLAGLLQGFAGFFQRRTRHLLGLPGHFACRLHGCRRSFLGLLDGGTGRFTGAGGRGRCRFLGLGRRIRGRLHALFRRSFGCFNRSRRGFRRFLQRFFGLLLDGAGRRFLLAATHTNQRGRQHHHRHVDPHMHLLAPLFFHFNSIPTNILAVNCPDRCCTRKGSTTREHDNAASGHEFQT
jgi:hypothetical protein